jgi:hypothetical protein
MFLFIISVRRLIAIPIHPILTGLSFSIAIFIIVENCNHVYLHTSLPGFILYLSESLPSEGSPQEVPVKKKIPISGIFINPSRNFHLELGSEISIHGHTHNFEPGQPIQ